MRRAAVQRACRRCEKHLFLCKDLVLQQDDPSKHLTGTATPFVSHQQEVGAGYFDDVTTVIQGGMSSVKALAGSTEEQPAR